MTSRRKGRILAFQALYAWEASGTPAEELAGFSWAEKPPGEEDGAFSRLLFLGTVENVRAVDKMIRTHLTNWAFSRLGRVDLAVLRMSAYTLMFQQDMPASIVIDEAIGIAKEFGADESYRFINGVLDSIRKALNR